MPRPTPSPRLRRLAADLALFAAIGVVMAFLGPFGTAERPLGERFLYWAACMIGGGAVGVLIDEAVRRLTAHFWVRLIAVSVAMTPPVTGVVLLVNGVTYGARAIRSVAPGLWFQVFVVSFAAMALRQLAWAEPGPAPSVDGPAADPLAAFRRRLSAKRREACVFAVEAEDHYLRVHTDAGPELITARFGDALSELAAAPGFRTHRSWWVAADAIEDVKWLRGRGEARVKGGLTVPISRSQAAALKDAGWF